MVLFICQNLHRFQSSFYDSYTGSRCFLDETHWIIHRYANEHAYVHAIGCSMHVTPAYDVTHVPLTEDPTLWPFLDRSKGLKKLL